jgi:signal transduction histidine kinase/ligand-binding sensor domain-containing protein
MRKPSTKPLRVCARALALLLLAHVALAETRVDPADVGRQTLRLFTDEDGVPQNAVTEVVLDREGYVWIGTKDGAARYDGRSWRVVNIPAQAGSNWVQTILPAADGRMWFGTIGGGVLVLAEDGSWTSYRVEHGLPDDSVYCLLETFTEGRPVVWAGTRRGLAAFEDGAWRRPPPIPNDSSDAQVDALIEVATPGGGRALWAGLANGAVARLSNGQWTVYGFAQDQPNRSVTCFFESTVFGEPTLLAGTFGRGIARFDGNAWTHWAGGPDGLPEGIVHAICETRRPDGTPTLWAGTNRGLERYENGRWIRFDAKHGLPSVGIWSLCEVGSQTGTPVLWVGTAGLGLARLQLEGWVAFEKQTGLSGNSVYSLLVTEDENGVEDLWVGLISAGVGRLREGVWTIYDDDRTQLPDLTIWSLAALPSPGGGQTIWAGTNRGLAHFANGRWIAHPGNVRLRDRAAVSLLATTSPAGAPRLLVGLRAGVWALDGEQFAPLVPGPELPDANDPRLKCLLETLGEDGARTLCIGTELGLVRFDGTASTTFGTADGLPSQFVLSLREVRIAGRRELWVGTRAGLARRPLDATSGGWQLLSTDTEPALPNNTIYRIEQDGRGRVYLFTNKGVARLESRVPSDDDPAEFSVYTFTTEDGLPSNECNTGASFVDSRGRLWAGTIGGAAMYDPAREAERSKAKALRLQNAALPGTGRTLAPGDELAYDQNNLVFEFSLLSYFREADTRYRTHLEGLDAPPSDWTPDSKKEYTSLPPGEYRFKVWGRDAFGNVSGPVEVPFSIRPAPWMAWWAWTLYGAAAAVLVYGGVQARLRRLRRRNEQLERAIAERTSDLNRKVVELDASERAATESERRALEANRAKSIFLANMSHELRTPLNAILGFVQLMGRDRSLGAEHRKDLAIITRSGEHLLSLITDVLSIAKIEAGRISLTEQAFDLGRLLDAVRSMISARADLKGLVVVFDVEPGMPAAVRGDEAKLRQVLLNLLGNAVKFTTEGTVTLRARWADGRACFEVQDTGPGISAEELDTLFQAFVQTEAGRQVQEGTGLGLVISRSFVRLMGGDIEVASRVGEGTTFRFEASLPRADAAEVVEERKVAGLAPGQPSRRMLVVDDTFENRALLARLLKSVGFDVREATNGQEAVAEWEASRPDLIFMDMRMPVMDGIEATREIRRREGVRSQGRQGLCSQRL